MAPPPIHMDGGDADHVQWSIDGGDESFDGVALEQAMREARDAAYRALAALDAA